MTEALADEVVLVLGGSGFVGANIGAAAQSSGATVILGSRRGEEADRTLLAIGGAAAEVVEIDYSSIPSVLASLRLVRPSIVVNATGSTSGDWHVLHEANVTPVATLIGAVLELDDGAKPVIVSVGSQAEYGSAPAPWTEGDLPRPTTPYGATKSAATALLSGAVGASGMRAFTVRLPIVFGPGQRPSMLIPEVIVNSLRGTATSTTGGRQRRRFVFAPDAAEGVLRLAMRVLEAQDVLPVLNGPAYPPETVLSMLDRIRSAADWQVALDVGALPHRSSEMVDSWPDTSRFESLEPGFGLTALDDALKVTLAWYRDNPWIWGGGPDRRAR